MLFLDQLMQAAAWKEPETKSRLAFIPNQFTTKPHFNVPHNASTDKSNTLIELHYVWCGDKFSFIDFVSIKSVFDATNAAFIHIHSHRNFVSSPDYIEWYKDVENLTPFTKVHCDGRWLCSSDLKINWDYVSSHILTSFPNGNHVFVQSNTVVFGNTLQRTLLNFTHVLVHLSMDNLPNSLSSLMHIQCSVVAANAMQDCAEEMCDSSKFSSANDCFYLVDRLVQPRDIMFANNAIAARIRSVVYGNEDFQLAKRHTNAVIPKVGHYCYFNNDRISMAFYLSMLSLLFVVRVDCIVLHGNKPPVGIYWEDIQTRGCVRWQYTPLVDEVWGNRVKILAHQADVVRGDVFVRYGGLHIDPDVYFVRPPPETFWHYDAVIALDAYPAAPMLGAMPRELGALINLGVCMSRPGSHFFQLYQQSQRQYYDSRWLYNSGVAPFHIYERHPDLAVLVPNMQLVCNRKICYPGWARNETEFGLLSTSASCLLPHVYALHLVDNPRELENPASLINSETLYANIAKRILDSANVDLRKFVS